MGELPFKRRAQSCLRKYAPAAGPEDQGLCLLQIRVSHLAHGAPLLRREIGLATQDALAVLLARGLRSIDLLGDGGPACFLVALPCIQAAAARMVAERLCALLLDSQARDASGTMLSLQVVVTMAAAVPGQALDAVWARLAGTPVTLSRGQRHLVHWVD
jgi:hypothetical protein